jgi:hypothetical protein
MNGSNDNENLSCFSFICFIAKVIPIEGGGDILRLEDLVVTNGPDLHVYLSTDKSASDSVNLGRLKANIWVLLWKEGSQL